MSDNINWNETAIYEFMRFEREPERRVFPDRDITKLAKAGHSGKRDGRLDSHPNRRRRTRQH